jgi:hypothetical protein
MRTGRMAMELEAELFEFADNRPVFETGELPHPAPSRSRTDH